MANQLGTRQLVIDTAAATVITYDNLKVSGMSFTGYVADAHEVIVQDARSKEVWRSNGASDLSAVESGVVGWVRGLIVPTLGSGKLIIFLE